MFEEDEDPQFNIADTVRSMAREVAGSIERMLGQAEIDQPAQSFGIDPDKAREWAESAAQWLRSHVEQAGEELADRLADREPAKAEAPTEPDRFRGRRTVPLRRHGEDPLDGAAPSPLDLPTAEQGLALAAVDSGRWTVEPGTEMLGSQGEGPGPSDALGLVRELRVRDWITAEGHLTLAGRRALQRWLEASG